MQFTPDYCLTQKEIDSGTEVPRFGIAAQSHALGFDPEIVYVPHPIQNRTAAKLAALADAAIEPALAIPVKKHK